MAQPRPARLDQRADQKQHEAPDEELGEDEQRVAHGSAFVAPGVMPLCTRLGHRGRAPARDRAPPAQLGADLIGDAHCAAALASASRLVVQALDASAGSLDDMARALRTAAGAYELADVLAIAPEQS